MSADPLQPPPGVSREDFVRHLEQTSKRTARRGDGVEFSDLVAQLATLPPETAEEKAEREKRIAESEQADRLAKFRKLCPPEFMAKIDPKRLTHPKSFDAVKTWDGTFPGPLATGVTGAAKTRAAWSAMYRLNVLQGRSLAWFPVKRLITEFLRYESKDNADEFWRYYTGYNVLLVDDLDKINWQFESEGAALFQFYDWIYRAHRPCITTTNKDRAWWADKMGDAFARRLFDEAHFTVSF